MNAQEKLEAEKNNLAAVKDRIARLKRRVREQKKKRSCRGCGCELILAGPGRPIVWCSRCRGAEPQRKWFREKYGEKLRVYQREYRRKYRKRQRELSDKLMREAQK